MEPERLLSFLEFDYRADAVRLGAWLGEDVLSRPINAPFLRILCLEPKAGRTRIRARHGTVTLGPDGLRDDDQDDPMLQLGAWAAVLTLFSSMATTLVRSRGELLGRLAPHQPHRIWLGQPLNRVSVITDREARLRLDPAEGSDGATVVQIEGELEDIDAMIQCLVPFQEALARAE